ncbi:MAG: DUF3145 family protein, partial [Actinobacteria bacterium]|nr:DUF3145 family protein [Actinomycetota bacterium]
NENQIQKILNENLNPTLALEEIENLLGKNWDEVLDPYRHMAMGGEDVDARLSV